MKVNTAKITQSGERIVLFGLDERLAGELGRVLTDQRKSVYSEPFLTPGECLGVIDRLQADLVFCAAEKDRYCALLEAVLLLRPDLPVVVVSRDPEVSEWLDAIEAGASDYCAAPFESSHIEWILNSTLKNRSQPVRYRAAS
jgi:DNA-binding NtrC family response regulator